MNIEELRDKALALSDQKKMETMSAITEIRASTELALSALKKVSDETAKRIFGLSKEEVEELTFEKVFTSLTAPIDQIDTELYKEENNKFNSMIDKYNEEVTKRNESIAAYYQEYINKYGDDDL